LQKWLVTQVDKLADETKVEIDRLKQQKDKLEREQQKLLQAHYADAIPLDLLKNEQTLIAKTLRNIIGQMEAFQIERTTTIDNLNDVFTLLDDCGRMYRLADDYQRRCYNQAFFDRIRVNDDLTLEADLAEPFDTLLNSDVFVLKSEFEKNIQNKKDGRPEPATHLSYFDVTTTNIATTQTGSEQRKV